MEKIILHIDCNSAYLSWTAVHRIQQGIPGPDLRTVPSAVGGNPETRSGIILAKSAPCKPFKIQTGETLHAAFQKCPSLVVVKPDYNLYMKCSNAMMSIIYDYSPSVKRFSIDECFVDLTGVNCFVNRGIDLALEIKERIKNELGFTVSVGVSTNKLLAKMASEFKKPDGLSTLWVEEIPTKMWPLPIADLYMCGRKTEKKLIERGIYTIGDLAKSDIRNIQTYLGKAFGTMLYDYAHGIETTSVDTIYQAKNKGIGNSTTTPYDLQTKEEAYMYLLALTEMVAMRLRFEQTKTSLVAVTLRDFEFNSYGHQRKLGYYTDSTTDIYNITKQLFDEMWDGISLRHLGVRVTDFNNSQNRQLTLFDPPDLDKQHKLDTAIDALRNRFGKKAIMRGVFGNSCMSPIIGGMPQEEMPIMTSIL